MRIDAIFAATDAVQAKYEYQFLVNTIAQFSPFKKKDVIIQKQISKR